MRLLAVRAPTWRWNAGAGANMVARVIALLAVSLGSIVYTFAGYPALMALIARVRPRPHRRPVEFLPRVSLIIAAYNEADVIERKLANTRALDYPADRLEVIVVADGSDDATADLAAAFGGVTVLHQPARRGKLAAITRATEAASGELLVFSDANNDYVPATLRELIAPFGDPAVGVVSGRKHISDAPVGDGAVRDLDRAEGLYWRYESKLKEWESLAGSVTAVAGEVLAFRREALYPTPAGMLTEDFVQAMTAAAHGWRVVYAPLAISVERASATIDDEAIRRARIVTGRWQAMARLLPVMMRRQPRLAWQMFSHKGLRPLIPGALLSTMLSTLSLARRRRWARGLAAVQLAFYSVAAEGRRRQAGGRALGWTYLPFYFCRMNLATMAGLAAFVRRRRDAAWTKVARG